MQDGLHRTLPLTAIKTRNPEIMVRFGNPVKEILESAAERGSELIDTRLGFTTFFNA